MPAGYDFACLSCGHSRSLHPRMEYRNDRDEMVVIPHPMESLRLKGLGTTIGEAKKAGRLYCSDDWACVDCGLITTHQFRLTPASSIGCRPYLLLVTAGVAGVVLASMQRAWGGWIAAAITAAVIVSVAAVDCRVTRTRYRNHRGSSRPSECPDCGGKDIRAPVNSVDAETRTELWADRSASATANQDWSSRRLLLCERCGKRMLRPVGYWIS